MALDWYYMWSDNYRFFHEILKDSVNEPEITLIPLKMPQELFDSELYKSNDNHFWHGSLIKVNTILNLLETAVGQSKPYILFTDVDIIVKSSVYNELKQYIDAGTDMVFLKENNIINIGFILLRVCPEVIDFWKLIRTKMQETVGLDQEYVNEVLKSGSYTGTYAQFDEQLFTSNSTYTNLKPFIVMQVLCTNLGKELNMAEKIFNMAQHINVESYMEYVSEDIIPFIYKFQDILHKSYMQHKIHKGALKL